MAEPAGLEPALLILDLGGVDGFRSRDLTVDNRMLFPLSYNPMMLYTVAISANEFTFG